ncbi:ArsR/SmtB family transcription factor [Spirillospora sp. NPDC050679]
MTGPSEDPNRPNPEPATAVLDAQGLRALAHPVRVQLVELLRKHGPSTATRLAERLGINSGATSYHLRRLGAAGFVAEDTGRGNARERWWRPVHQTTRFDDLELAGHEATLAFLQSVAAVSTLRLQRTISEFPAMPRAWQEVFDMSDHRLRLTAEEAADLQRELNEVLARYRRDLPGTADAAPDGAERVVVVSHILPELEPSTGPEPPGEAEARAT